MKLVSLCFIHPQLSITPFNDMVHIILNNQLLMINLVVFKEKGRGRVGR